MNQMVVEQGKAKKAQVVESHLHQQLTKVKTNSVALCISVKLNESNICQLALRTHAGGGLELKDIDN